MQSGNIGVTTENIFPVIKKFLYSDHEIFLRELVSNAVDAVQKLKTQASMGDFKGETGDLTIHVSLSGDTLTISDRGIGMTKEEIDKYINQIAFSGANDFLDKYKNDAGSIIGHFGLGFYSAFMVASKVEILSLSAKEGSQAVRWTCDGSPSYQMEDAEKADRGTDIILHIDEDCKEFLEEQRISALLQKYCKFLPVPIAFGKKKEWKDGKQVETDEDNIINSTEPIWGKKPTDLKDEDYRSFYSTLYPMGDEPLFWIHLNVDFPFHLTGVLYFPKVKRQVELSRNKIQLYCNQVFVTDSVEGIVPDFLTLLHGVLDSPDIPLNVSRSYLQSDSNVKKISTYITKKVSDRLQDIFKKDREQFQSKWDDLKLFIEYGMLTEDSFYDRAKDFSLYKDTEGKYFTFEEYKKLIEANQTDKDGNLIVLYANDADTQYSFISDAKNLGYNTLLMDCQLDTALVGLLERKMEKTRFVRVDSDVAGKLIAKEDAKGSDLSAQDASNLEEAFMSQMPKNAKTEFNVTLEAMGENASPVTVTQSEYMRRMKEMAQLQPGMGFYGEMPDMLNLVLNTDHKIIKRVIEEGKEALKDSLSPVVSELDTTEKAAAQLRDQKKGKKDEEVPQSDKDMLNDLDKRCEELRAQKKSLVSGYAAGSDTIHQLIDLALLKNGMLKGEALAKFVERSIKLI